MKETQIISTSLVLLMSCLLILATASFAQNASSTNNERTDHIPINLLPKTKTKPASFDSARITGRLDRKDRDELELLVGRVPYLRGKVESVATCWEENVVAAKITRDHRLIYCTKADTGQWHIVSIILFSDAPTP